MRDYVEIRGGDGLDPHLMTIAEDFCGVDSMPSKLTIYLIKSDSNEVRNTQIFDS